MGNTFHVTDAAGHLLERYIYSAFGTPSFFNASGAQIGSSSYGIRHLFQGQLWTQETGLNDHRNRQALPAMGVFLQPDPIGFRGDPNNVYRYCGNNSVNNSDPMGLDLVEVVHPQSVFHTSFGVTDPTSSTGKTWFDFSPLYQPSTINGTVPGYWEAHTGTPPGIGFPIKLTPELDLVALAAFYDALEKGGQTYNYFTSNCIQTGERTFNGALFSADGRLINPLDPDTGNIYDGRGNWVGWENPDTGNIYDADGDWAGWNPKWNSNDSSESGGTVGYNGPNGGSGSGPSVLYGGLFTNFNDYAAYEWWGGSTQSRIPVRPH